MFTVKGFVQSVRLGACPESVAVLTPRAKTPATADCQSKHRANPFHQASQDKAIGIESNGSNYGNAI